MKVNSYCIRKICLLLFAVILSITFLQGSSASVLYSQPCTASRCRLSCFAYITHYTFYKTQEGNLRLRHAVGKSLARRGPLDPVKQCFRSIAPIVDLWVCHFNKHMHMFGHFFSLQLVDVKCYIDVVGVPGRIHKYWNWPSFKKSRPHDFSVIHWFSTARPTHSYASLGRFALPSCSAQLSGYVLIGLFLYSSFSPQLCGNYRTIKSKPSKTIYRIANTLLVAVIHRACSLCWREFTGYCAVNVKNAPQDVLMQLSVLIGSPVSYTLALVYICVLWKEGSVGIILQQT